MAKAIAKIFMHGRSQAVRLPKEFRLPGTEVTVRRGGSGILLEPIEKKFDYDKWLAQVQALAGSDFLPEERPDQSPWPDDDDITFE